VTFQYPLEVRAADHRRVTFWGSPRRGDLEFVQIPASRTWGVLVLVNVTVTVIVNVTVTVLVNAVVIVSSYA
jgi:hypothetical protein